jgi:hypothetical protein
LRDLSLKYEALLADYKEADEKLRETALKLSEKDTIISEKDRQIESLCSHIKPKK